MPTRLKASLAYPVTTAGSPPLLLETFLDAVTYLHAREQQYACPEAGRMVDRLMLAAASQERSEMQQATRQLEEFLTSRSW
jgi:hypothetical protein